MDLIILGSIGLVTLWAWFLNVQVHKAILKYGEQPIAHFRRDDLPNLFLLRRLLKAYPERKEGRLVYPLMIATLFTQLTLFITWVVRVIFF